MLAKPRYTLQVEVSKEYVPVRDLRSREDTKALWPFLKLSAWAKHELERGGEMLLGGHNIRDERLWKEMLTDFWARYRDLDTGHPVYTSGLDPGLVIPYMVHGDEGRGRQKLPLLTISFQCLISHYGPHRLNMSGYSGMRLAIFSKSSLSICFGSLHWYLFFPGCCGQAFILQSPTFYSLPVPMLRSKRRVHLRAVGSLGG